MRRAIQIGLLGLGTVGGSVVKIVQENAANISQKVGLPLKISRVLVRIKRNKEPLIQAMQSLPPILTIYWPTLL